MIGSFLTHSSPNEVIFNLNEKKATKAYRCIYGSPRCGRAGATKNDPPAPYDKGLFIPRPKYSAEVLERRIPDVANKVEY